MVEEWYTNQKRCNLCTNSKGKHVKST